MMIGIIIAVILIFTAFELLTKDSRTIKHDDKEDL